MGCKNCGAVFPASLIAAGFMFGLLVFFPAYLISFSVTVALFIAGAVASVATIIAMLALILRALSRR